MTGHAEAMRGPLSAKLALQVVRPALTDIVVHRLWTRLEPDLRHAWQRAEAGHRSALKRLRESRIKLAELELSTPVGDFFRCALDEGYGLGDLVTLTVDGGPITPEDAEQLGDAFEDELVPRPRNAMAVNMRVACRLSESLPALLIRRARPDLAAEVTADLSKSIGEPRHDFLVSRRAS